MTVSPLGRRLLTLPPSAVSFAGLGFAPTDAVVRSHLEKVLTTFVHGYNLSLAIPDQAELAAPLRQQLDDHFVGFAFEGAGMAYALRDLLAPWRPLVFGSSHLHDFFEGAGRDHDYIAAVGDRKSTRL